jgi:hypothetical protein
VENAGHLVAGREHYDLAAPTVEKWIVLHHQGGDASLN